MILNICWQKICPAWEKNYHHIFFAFYHFFHLFDISSKDSFLLHVLRLACGRKICRIDNQIKIIFCPSFKPNFFSLFQSSEFFAFACLMVADTLLFSVMAYFYVSYSAPEGKVEYSRTVADPDVNDTSTLVDSMAGSSSPKVKVVKAVQDGEDKED